MKLIISGIFIDVVLLVGFLLCAPIRINLLILLAFMNLLFFFFLQIRVVRKAGRNEHPVGIPLEFVLSNTFMATGIWIFYLVSQILDNMCFS